MFCMCLVNEYDVWILIVEYLNVVLVGLGIDNIVIEVNVLEILIMDGSVVLFVYLLFDVGIDELNCVKKFVCIKEIVWVEDGDKWVEFRLYNGFMLDFIIDFNYLVIDFSSQCYVMNFFVDVFMCQISCVCIFGFMCDIEYLQFCGLCLGGSFDCVIVVDDYCVLNEDGLCFEDEFVCYKMFDVIGDLFMCGYNIIGVFIVYKFGYVLNNKLLQVVLVKQEVWEFVIFQDDVELLLVFKVFLMVLV